MPRVMVSDNATIFTSAEFQNFCRVCGIYQKHISPGHPATNGQVERYVGTVKSALKRMRMTSTVPLHVLVRDFLLQFRATPGADGKSPAEKYLNRKIRLPLAAIRPSSTKSSKVTTARRNFEVGERIVLAGDNRKFGTVIRRVGSLHYIIRLDGGYERKAHVNQLLHTDVPSQKPPTLAQPKSVRWAPTLVEKQPASIPSTSPVPSPVSEDVQIRRSNRERRQPDRLMYS